MKTIKCSKVVVYRKHPKRENELSKKVIEAVCDFLENSNINYEICIIRNDAKRMGDHYIPGEIGIVYGIPKYVRKDYLGMKKLFELQNNMIVIERGYIKRDKYHSIGWNGMNGYANFLNKDMPDNRFKKLKVKLKKWRPGKEKILITGQVPWDSNVQSLYSGENKQSRGEVSMAYISWLRTIYDKLIDMGHSDNIVFRPHPYLFELSKDFTSKYESAIPRELWSTNKTIEEDLSKAKVLITYNSNSAVDAVISGIPVIVGDKGSMAWDVANKSISDLNNLKMLERKYWINDIAYSQWNLDEIKKGLWWDHLVKEKK